MKKRIVGLLFCLTLAICAFTGCSGKEESGENAGIFDGYDENKIIHVTAPEYFNLKDVLKNEDQYLLEEIIITENENGTYDYAFTETTQNSVKYALDKEVFELLSKYTENFKYNSIVCSKNRAIVEFYTDAKTYEGNLEIKEDEYIDAIENFNIINGTKIEDFIYYVINEETDEVLFTNHPEHARIRAKDEEKTNEEKMAEAMIKEANENAKENANEEKIDEPVENKTGEEITEETKTTVEGVEESETNNVETDNDETNEDVVETNE